MHRRIWWFVGNGSRRGCRALDRPLYLLTVDGARHAADVDVLDRTCHRLPYLAWVVQSTAVGVGSWYDILGNEGCSAGESGQCEWDTHLPRRPHIARVTPATASAVRFVCHAVEQGLFLPVADTDTSQAVPGTGYVCQMSREHEATRADIKRSKTDNIKNDHV